MEPSHKELLIGLIGNTYGELKRLDDSIIGSSSTLGRRSDQVKNELSNILKGVPPPPDVPVLQKMQEQASAIPGIPAHNPAPQPPEQYVQPQPAPQYAPQIMTLPHIVQGQAPEPQPITDPGQLELPLDKTTKYEDIINNIDRLYERMSRLEDKMDTIIKILSTTKKKDRGLNVS